MTASKRTRQGNAIGGLRAAANLTPEQRSERSRNAAREKWRIENERRAAAGEPPTKKAAPEPSAKELEPYLEDVDRRWPDREWPSREARRRQAVILWRTDLAETIAKALGKGNA